MRKRLLLSVSTLACLFMLSACASRTNAITEAKIDQSEQVAIEELQKNAMFPEEIQIIRIGRSELDSAIKAYGREKYDIIFPAYSAAYAKFINAPSVLTKNELMTFLRDNEMFAQIVKPAPDSIFNSAKAKGLILMGYDGAECDYAKIEAYLDKKITDFKNGTKIRLNAEVM